MPLTSLSDSSRSRLQHLLARSCSVLVGTSVLVLVALQVLRFTPEFALRIGESRNPKSIEADRDPAVEARMQRDSVAAEPALQWITLQFAGDNIDLELHQHHPVVRNVYARGERIVPGRLSRWTGWTYSDLRKLGEGSHQIINKQSQLSNAQRITLKIAPSSNIN